MLGIQVDSSRASPRPALPRYLPPSHLRTPTKRPILARISYSCLLDTCLHTLVRSDVAKSSLAPPCDGSFPRHLLHGEDCMPLLAFIDDTLLQTSRSRLFPLTSRRKLLHLFIRSCHRARERMRAKSFYPKLPASFAAEPVLPAAKPTGTKQIRFAEVQLVDPVNAVDSVRDTGA